MAHDYEVIVIGGGPGGYVAAIKAAQLGKKVCIIEGEHFGGTCLNVGCIPTKALIKGANVYEAVQAAGQYGICGIDPNALTIDMKKLQVQKRRVVNQLVNGVKSLLRANGVTSMTGFASFVDVHTVSVGGKMLSADDIIIATGSKNVIPGFIAQEGVNHIVSSTELLDIETLPDSIVIIGGGVIGIEFAYLLNTLGVKVTVVELAGHILPLVDQEIADLSEKKLAKDGVTFHLNARVRMVRNDHVIFEKDGKEQEVSAEMILIAVGRAPNTDGLNAEGVGLEFDGKAIKADASQRTNIPHVYAIGDVNGKAMLAHTSFSEGEIAARCICGDVCAMDYRYIPSCIYVEPEIASVGLTEEQARQQYGDKIKVGKFRMAANGKSLIEGDNGGMCKVILDSEYGEILGVHLFGKHVTEMIAEMAVAMNLEATVEEIIATVHPHPSVSEALREAFMAAWDGKSIHSL